MNTHEPKNKFLELLKKNKDIAWFISIAIGLGYFINGKFEKMEEKFDKRFEKIEDRLSIVEKDVSAIKMVLMLNHMMPEKFCEKEKK